MTEPNWSDSRYKQTVLNAFENEFTDTGNSTKMPFFVHICFTFVKLSFGHLEAKHEYEIAWQWRRTKRTELQVHGVTTQGTSKFMCIRQTCECTHGTQSDLGASTSGESWGSWRPHRAQRAGRAWRPVGSPQTGQSVLSRAATGAWQPSRTLAQTITKSFSVHRVSRKRHAVPWLHPCQGTREVLGVRVDPGCPEVRAARPPRVVRRRLACRRGRVPRADLAVPGGGRGRHACATQRDNSSDEKNNKTQKRPT